MKKKGFLGHKIIEYDEPDMSGEYTYVHGEWIFFQTNKA